MQRLGRVNRPRRVCCRSLFSFWLLVVTFSGLSINRLVFKWSCLSCGQLAASKFGLAGQVRPSSTAFFGIATLSLGTTNNVGIHPNATTLKSGECTSPLKHTLSYFLVLSPWKCRTCKIRQQIIGLYDELKKLCTGTRRAETCVAPRLDMHVDASCGALRTSPFVVVLVFVVRALSVFLVDFLRTSNSSSMGRKAKGGVCCQIFSLCFLFPVSKTATSGIGHHTM